ncbi:hypothetical protein PG990_009026 [Apiospora arundinis]
MALDSSESGGVVPPTGSKGGGGTSSSAALKIRCPEPMGELDDMSGAPASYHISRSVTAARRRGVLGSVDVDLLMKQGFVITLENTVQEEGYFERNTVGDALCQKQFPHRRHYYFKDTEQEPSHWVARMQCLSGTLEGLVNIQPQDLSHCHVVYF